MKQGISFIFAGLAALCFGLSVQATKPSPWNEIAVEALRDIDDDVGRNIGTLGFFDDIDVSEYRFTENGFDWHLVRFVSTERPAGPLWMVPHDDESAAFDAMIAAVKAYGGVGIAVNSGPGSSRLQTGNGICGVRSGVTASCDPNRNFDAKTPLFTSAFLNLRAAGQPVIALHTNSPGFSGDGKGGRGEITIWNIAAARRGEFVPRSGGILAVNPVGEMANADTLGLTAYLAREGGPDDAKAKCGQGIANDGIHFWHERVAKSDGSMSNYLALNRPDIAYFNAESRSEANLAIAAARHGVMISAYLKNCIVSGNKPTP